MSHFACLAIVPKQEVNDIHSYIEKALAPFDENKEVPHVVKNAEELMADFDMHNSAHPDDPYESIITFAEEWFGYSINKKGEAVSDRNPDSKWDWWSVGGRWSGILKLKKSDERRDILPFGDIDFDTMTASNIQKAEKNWAAAEGKNGQDRFLNHGVGKEDTHESFVFERSFPIVTFAVITKDGKWHERGSMGWWAIVSDEKETYADWASKYQERFLNNLDSEDVLVILDLHI